MTGWSSSPRSAGCWPSSARRAAAAASWTSRSRWRSRPSATSGSPTRATAGWRSSPPPAATAPRSRCRRRPASGWTPAATSGCPAPATRRATRSGSSPRPGSSCGRSAPPRRAYGDLGDPGGHRGRPGRADLRRAAGLRPGVGVQPGRALLHRVRPAAGPGQAGEDLEFPQGLAVTATGAGLGGRQRPQPDRPVRPGPGLPATGAPAAPGSPSRPLIIGECLLALVIVGLGWYLARRRPPDPGTADTPVDTPARRRPRPGPNSPAAACSPPPPRCPGWPWARRCCPSACARRSPPRSRTRPAARSATSSTS